MAVQITGLDGAEIVGVMVPEEGMYYLREMDTRKILRASRTGGCPQLVIRAVNGWEIVPIREHSAYHRLDYKFEKPHVVKSRAVVKTKSQEDDLMTALRWAISECACASDVVFEIDS